MRAKVFFYLCSGVIVLGLIAAHADARQAVTLRLHPEVTTVRQGDPLRLDLTLTNAGTAPVRLWVPVLWGSGNYDLRRAEEPLIPLDEKPDSSMSVPLLRALLRAPAVRVVVTPRGSAR